MGFDYNTAALIAENTFTGWLSPYKTNEQRSGYLDVSATGTWAGTLTIQKRISRDGTYTDPIDVDTSTANLAKLIEDHVANVEYRIGFKTGEFTSGTANVRIER